MELSIEFYLKGILLLLLFFCARRDWKDGIIPNEYLIRGIAIRILLLLHEVATEGVDAAYHLLIKAGMGILILCIGILIRKLTKDGIGMGDIKLLGVMNLYLSLEEWIESLLRSFVFGLLASIIIIVRKKEAKRIPFAPFLFAGTIVGICISVLG